jgi:hypothetical protein
VSPVPQPEPWPFRCVARSRGGRGTHNYKTIPSERMVWVGIWRGRAWELHSKPRLINPLESFMTSSGMRLRDSWVGSGGHWVEIVVHRPRHNVSDAELEQLTAMAQAIDPRPCVARRKADRARFAEE